jgi:hypothetical protein
MKTFRAASRLPILTPAMAHMSVIVMDDLRTTLTKPYEEVDDTV